METNMIIDIVAKILIPLIGAILTIIVWPLIQAKTTKEQRNAIAEIVRIAVFAAEQLHDAGLLEIPKKAFVVDYLSKQGINITMKDMDLLIESAVKELNILQDKGLD